MEDPEISNTRIIARLVIAFLAYALAFFGGAGTLLWPEAWLMILIQFAYSIPFIFWLQKNNPQLLKQRMKFVKKNMYYWDYIIIIVLIPAFTALFVLPGIDVIRYQWSSMPLSISYAGFVVFTLSFLILTSTLKENTYASRYVEIQKDKGHRVIDTGPYALVRHPMYSGVMLMIFAIPLALGSFYALIPAFISNLGILLRIFFEEETLHQNLPGYTKYTKKVKYRLIPLIW